MTIKYWKVGTKEDSLFYYAVAPNRNVAIRLVEQIVGPFNPSRVLCTELPQAPKGYLQNPATQYVMEEDPDSEE
jgi:hypothetical protein